MARQKVAEKQVTSETDLDFQACVSPEQRQNIERTAVEFGINRRIMLALLGRSREQLISGGDGDKNPEKVGDVIMLMLDSVAEYEKHLQDMAGLAKSASARLIAAAQTMVDRGMVE